MKNPKVGERVKVYQLGLCGTLTDFCSVIYDINEYGALLVHKERNILANPKQCRRLVKKKCKEIWVIDHPGLGDNMSKKSAMDSLKEAQALVQMLFPNNATITRYVQAKDQK